MCLLQDGHELYVTEEELIVFTQSNLLLVTELLREMCKGGLFFIDFRLLASHLASVVNKPLFEGWPTDYCSMVRYRYIYKDSYSRADTYQIEFFNNIYYHAEDQPPHFRHTCCK